MDKFQISQCFSSSPTFSKQWLMMGPSFSLCRAAFLFACQASIHVCNLPAAGQPSVKDARWSKRCLGSLSMANYLYATSNMSVVCDSFQARLLSTLFVSANGPEWSCCANSRHVKTVVWTIPNHTHVLQISHREGQVSLSNFRPQNSSQMSTSCDA